MTKSTEIVQRIESHYVGEDGAQIMFPYKRFMTIANKDGIAFYTHIYSDTYINKYLEDDRKNQFPYSTIPTHRQFNGLGIFHHVNQILDYEQPYIRIGDTGIFEHFVIKDGPTALALTKVMPSTQTTKIVTRKELESLLEHNDDSETSFCILNIYGNLFPNLEKIDIPSEEQIIEYLKKEFEEALQDCTDEGNLSKYKLEYLKQIIQSSDLQNISNLKCHIPFSPVIIIKFDGVNITIEKITITCLGLNSYELNRKVFLPSTYALEHLKLMTTKILRTKEPNIPGFLNLEISKKEVQLAKKRIRELQQKKR